MGNLVPYKIREEEINPSEKLSLRKQADLLGVSLSSYYYQPELNEQEQHIMMRIQDIYSEFPVYGVRRMKEQLRRDGYQVGSIRVKKYMGLLGLCAIYPKKKTSIPDRKNLVYPYLLRNVQITHKDQVWSTDITYIKLPKGYVYLVAVMDWYSRKIIDWDLSTTMDKHFCCNLLKEALTQGTPEAFNVNQGSQFTSREFIGILEGENIKVSMDGVRRCYDNIRIERFWRTLKHEDIHLHDYQTPVDVRHGLFLFIPKYNDERLHEYRNQYATPSEIYAGIIQNMK